MRRTQVPSSILLLLQARVPRLDLLGRRDNVDGAAEP